MTAAGLDLLAYGGYPENSTVTVYGTDDTTVLATLGPIFGSGNTPIQPGFAGYYAPEGIGELLVSVGPTDFGPVIDNLEFGQVPEPSTIFLFVAGLSLLIFLKNRISFGACKEA